jgi:hypothetical protein
VPREVGPYGAESCYLVSARENRGWGGGERSVSVHLIERYGRSRSYFPAKFALL